VGELITWLAWRTNKTPSEWFEQPTAAILTTLRFINERDRAEAKEAQRG
jgi:hypothetical protein